MTKAIFIILTLSGFASGAEMEVADRLSVDGSSLFKSTAVFSGSVGIGTGTVSGTRLAVIGSTDTAYSLAVGTNAAYNLVVSTTGDVGIGTTSPAQKLDVAGNINATVLYQGGNKVMDTSMLDSFTLKFDTTTNKITLADRIEQNIMLDAFKIAVSSSLSKFNMVDGVMDEFEDQTGIDVANSSHAAYNSVGKYFTNDANYGGIDSNTKFCSHFNGPDGSGAIVDNGVTGHVISPSGGCTTISSQKKIGAGSIIFDGSDNMLTSADHDDWDFGTGDFTIDFWIRFNSSLNQSCVVMDHHNSSTNGSWQFIYGYSGGARHILSSILLSPATATLSFQPGLQRRPLIRGTMLH